MHRRGARFQAATFITGGVTLLAGSRAEPSASVPQSSLKPETSLYALAQQPAKAPQRDVEQPVRTDPRVLGGAPISPRTGADLQQLERMIFEDARKQLDALEAVKRVILRLQEHEDALIEE